MLESIGKKIREAREDLGISQKDLGISLGLSDKAISAYEAGRTVPPLETLVRIADELNKPLDFFIDGNSSDYKLESRLAAMERVVTKLLQEIHRIQDYLGVNAEKKEQDNKQEQSKTQTSSTPTQETSTK